MNEWENATTTTEFLAHTSTLAYLVLMSRTYTAANYSCLNDNYCSLHDIWWNKCWSMKSISAMYTIHCICKGLVQGGWKFLSTDKYSFQRFLLLLLLFSSNKISIFLQHLYLLVFWNSMKYLKASTCSLFPVEAAEKCSLCYLKQAAKTATAQRWLHFLGDREIPTYI